MKDYGFLCLPKNIGKNVDKNISRHLNCKYSQKLLDHAKQLATEARETVPKIEIQKTADKIADLIGNEIANKITKASKN